MGSNWKVRPIEDPLEMLSSDKLFVESKFFDVSGNLRVLTFFTESLVGSILNEPDVDILKINADIKGFSVLFININYFRYY